MPRRHTEPAAIPLLEFATLLGISDSLAYKLAREQGHIAGVRAFKVGHLWMVLRAPALAVLAGEPGTISVPPPSGSRLTLLEEVAS